MVDTPAEPAMGDSIPSPRRDFAADVDRTMVVAEAKLLVKELDRYLELIGAWAAEGWDEADATQ